MRIKSICLFCVLCIVCINGENEAKNGSEKIIFSADDVLVDEKSHKDSFVKSEKLYNSTIIAEKALKNFLKKTIKNFLPRIMNYESKAMNLSTKCMGGFFKYLAGLSNVKLWALQMLDATSKPPAGILEGTFSDFGAFDMCLDIQLPKRNGGVDFTGKYCAVEARPHMPPLPKHFSVYKQIHNRASPLDTIGEEMRRGGLAFLYMKFRFGVCIPSVCSLEDMQSIAKAAAERIDAEIEIPQCYVKEPVVFKPVHIAVIFTLAFLILICIIASIFEHKIMKHGVPTTDLSGSQQALLCFSLISNYRRFSGSSQGSEELKVLHGLKALSMAWVIMAHSYAWRNFLLLRKPDTLISVLEGFESGPLTNGWVAVEVFFFLSGFLTSYAVLKIMPKTKGRINIPIYILRRYIRLTPQLILVMGLIYFMPLISSGPFWYERIDPEIKACDHYWWMNLLYISNWAGVQNVCIHTTWYLSADFQFYIISIAYLLLLYRYPKIALSLISAFVFASVILIGAITYIRDLPPVILVTSGNYREILETLDNVHMNTFTHAGPYYIGFVLGYIVIKYRNIKISRVVLLSGWATSALLCLTAIYGVHDWKFGNPPEKLVTVVFAALHRTTFILGVAWVIFVCITGNGGYVNKILSSAIFAPFGRLTYMIYLMHSLVAWMRIASVRERAFFSHYNMMYECIGNIAFSVAFTVPLYLILEAPLANLDRLVFSKLLPTKGRSPENQPNGYLHANIAESTRESPKNMMNTIVPMPDTILPVELMSVKRLEIGYNNFAFNQQRYSKSQ